jgi:TetR/AcrR family transcriptional regulator, transcriptional repressor of aconitase
VPKVSPEHSEARRAEILDGARRAFSRWGYEGATVARLESEIGLSRGAIFHYFGSKLDLFVALAIEENHRYISLIVERGFDEALRSMANESPEWLGMLLEIQGRLRHDQKFVEKMESRLDDRERILVWLQDAQARGELRSDIEAIELGRFATMVLNGLALRVAGEDPVDVESVVALLHDALDPRT